ncbi:kinesin motor domain-containing protein [Pseudomassariella vexata]|uniref:Kinesin motor domain-containing protein n=1 Tax=Pseudomassariella vexata TaxID=1141098 RepID=A0A1Y2DF94_9PEZI|nr:kinesin motor domain-containing protein [Pseudomassariella vexata]ORY57806.1 kinesin motor domain-containing protein [Pseudomassariella vexata]
MVAEDPGASSITVAVRVRPFTIREAAQLHRNDEGTIFLGDGSLAAAPTPKLKQSGIRSVIKVVDDRCLVFDPPEDNPVQKFSRSVVPNGKKVKDQVFAFDRIFDENVTQAEVYEGTTKNLLDSVLDGYNATVFAYGATGCGKTHTITGTSQMPGIIFLTMQELFEKIADRSDEKHTELTLSYLEIYNETIRDLLVPGGSKQGLMLREDSNQGVSVAGLTSHHPKDVQEVMDMIVRGNEYRTVSPTEANATSSRSHAVLQINIAQKDRNAAVNEPHTMATLSIIDLAGSERASATKNRGERLLEGANINKSLLALGSCINALCDARKKNHVPYRNSKLTRLLKFSLGGNCKTVMIVCVSPSSAHFDETQNTLRYANRAKNIQTKVTRNVFNVNRHVKDFLVKIDEQMALINELKAQQKNAEKLSFAKFQKQLDKRDLATREGIQRIRLAYENSSPERQEKVAHMKKLRCIERRIGLLSSWIAAFDGVCDTKEDDDCMPPNLAALRKTAQGVLIELENSRHHIHQKLEKTNWERAIDSALQHSISQLPTGAGYADTGEISTLQREAELLKSNFTREAYRDVLDQDKAGDAGMMQALLTAQFEILACLSETMNMDEGEAVAHAKRIITRLLDVGYSAASHIVKPEGGKMPVERFSPSKRGTPKRKKAANVMLEAALPIHNAALAAFKSTAPVESSQLCVSPGKGSPRRRKALNARKGVTFSPVKKKSPSKRMVRWRDDDGESGTLADFEKTPQKPKSTSVPSSPEKSSSGKSSPEETVAVPSDPSYLGNDSAEDSSISLVLPETTVIPPAKPNRFQAGFLSKARPSTGPANGSPVPPTLSLNLTSDEERNSPLRNLDLSRAANIRAMFRRVSSTPPKASSLPLPLNMRSTPPPAAADENQPPSSDSEGNSSLFDTDKLRSALHATKRRDRLSSLGVPSAAAGARRVSSIGSSVSTMNGAQKGSNNYTGPLASSTNGISRLRRSSAERRRSPPISCSPPGVGVKEVNRSFTPGQARRMGFGGSVRVNGSPNERAREREASMPVGGIAGKGRRITIGGAAMAGNARRERAAMGWR